MRASRRSGIWMLSRTGEVEITPASSAANWIWRAESKVVNEIPASDNSKAYFGGGSLKSVGSSLENVFISALTFDKRDLVDLLQRRDAILHPVNRRFAQERHAFLAREPFNLRSRAPGQNHLADLLAQIEQFVDRGSPAEPCAAALEAAGAFVKR